MVRLPLLSEHLIIKYLSEEIYPPRISDLTYRLRGFICSCYDPLEKIIHWQMALQENYILVETFPHDHEIFLALRFGIVEKFTGDDNL